VSIVVGVDGSPGSRAALVFAFGEASLRRVPVVALHAWVLPLVEAPGPFLLELPSPHDVGIEELRGQLAAVAAARLDAALAEVEPDAAGVEIERRVVEAPAAQALVDASEHADLVVLGSRGHGGFRGLLLGSVGLQCAQHARCPLVIVPHER
jgi:nucleotide-binding universal stress UspA family protein